MEGVVGSQILSKVESTKYLISSIFEKGVELEYANFYCSSATALCPRDGCQRISYCGCDCNDGW